METRRGWIRRIALIGCGAVFLGLLGNDTMAAKRQSQFWPNGASISTHVYYSDFYGAKLPYFELRWPLGLGVDHYRLTVYYQVNKVYVLQSDVSPATYIEDSDRGEAITNVGANRKGNYLIVVTAYSAPDETVAYSESLQTSARSPGGS